MVHGVHVRADDLQVVHVADEAVGLVAQLVARGLGLVGTEREEKAPAVRLAHEDHPLRGVAEVRQVGVVARTGHVEVAHEVDQHVALLEGVSADRDPELFADRGTSTVAGQESAAADRGRTVRGRDLDRDVVTVVGEPLDPVPHPERSWRPALELGRQHGLELVLGDVDHEREARLVGQRGGQDAAGRLTRGTVELADLVDPQARLEHRTQGVVAVEHLEGAGQDRAGLGVGRQLRVGLEDHDRDPVRHQSQCGDQSDGPAADDDDGIGRGAHRSSWE